MVALTRTVGVLLAAAGIGAYALTGGESVTALIPAFLGVPVLVLGLLAGDPGRRSTMLTVVAVLAALGVVGTFGNLLELPQLLAGGDVERPTAVAVSAITAVLCVVLLVGWFAERRRAG